MVADEKICRICIQIIGKDLPYSTLPDNRAVLQNLNIISSNTVKNLKLTEEPLICNLCDKKLEKVANFKDTIIANEFKIQCNQKTDLNAFLLTLSDNFEGICRLCLKTSEEKKQFKNNWHDRVELLSKCNIHMNLNIGVPTKICNICDLVLQTIEDFMYLCSQNEQLIVDLFSKKGKLVSNDLLTMSTSLGSTLQKCMSEDQNNALSKEEKKEESKKRQKKYLKKLVVQNKRTIRKKPEDSPKSSKGDNRTSKQNNSMTEYMTTNVKEGLEILKKKTNASKAESEDVTFNVTKTPNTYKSKKSKSTDFTKMPSTSQAGQLNSKLMDRKYILKKIKDQIRQMHDSIDASPLSDLTDITLDVDDTGLVLEEAATEYNATQELIDVLEGRLNDTDINYATQELIDVLEGKLDENESHQNGEVNSKPKKEKGGRPPKMPNLCDKKSPVQKMYSKILDNTDSLEQNDRNKQVNIIKVVTIPNKKGSRNTVAKSTKIIETPSSQAEKKRQGLRQKTIITSFKEMFDITPLKNKELVNKQPLESDALSDNLKKKVVRKCSKKAKVTPEENATNAANDQPVKTSALSDSPKKKAEVKTTSKKPKVLFEENVTNIDIVETNNSEEGSSSKINNKESVLEVTEVTSDDSKTANTAPKKRSNKANENNAPLKKRIKSEPVDQDTTKSTIEASEQFIENISVHVNEPSKVTREKHSASSDDDKFVEEIHRKLDNRSVNVTIIKGKKRTNKAQLDKTWKELTGKPDGTKADLGGGLEIQVIKKKRGRPPLPGKEARMLTKKKVVWQYCDLCAFKTYAPRCFVQHQLIHNVMSKIQTLHCDSCRFITTNKELLLQHQMTHSTPGLSFKCVFCPQFFKKKSSCMNHTLRHDDQDVASQFYCLVYNASADEEYYECYQCDYQNVEESPMPDHVIDHTIEKPNLPIIAKFKCDLCTYRTKTSEMLKRHKNNHQVAKNKNPGQIEFTDLPLLKCDKCHYVSRNSKSLANHKGLKHNRSVPMPIAAAAAKAEAVKEEKEIYYCNDCSYSTHRKLNMPRHVLVHRTKENMEFYECTYCIFETKHRRSYTRHLEARHGVIP